jgi:hypothetical protein
MTPRSTLWLLGLLGLLASLPLALASAQTSALHGPPPITPVESSLRYLIPGTIKDLARDSAGRILYCTAEREVGRLRPGFERTVLATAASGPFPNELRAVADTPAGDVAVLDVHGHVRLLPGGTATAVLAYSDLYMILDATDLIVDALGNYLIASATPTSGQRAVNWVQGDGAKWGYYLVKHQPVQLAADPLTGGIVLSETSSGGNLQLVQAGSPIRATTALDSTTHPGISSSQDDGDLAAEVDGDLYWIAGGSVYKHTRETATTALFAGGFAQLRGVTIAASTPFVESATGWSLYLAEGSNPTQVREIPSVGAPGPVRAQSQGPLPGRGTKINVTFGFQAFELTADNSGRLLLGGSNFGGQYLVKRVDLTGTPSIATVATAADGLAGLIEGLCVAPDNSIYALSRDGVIQRITEGPFSITTVFSDPGDQITAGKDLALDVNGTLYVAAREAWDFGKVMSVSGGVATLLALTEETRGLAANPTGGMYLSQWRNMGFAGTVDLLRFSDNSIQSLPGFAGMNYTNGEVWGDGDICVDAAGNVYTLSEDDWSLVRYHDLLGGFERIGSGYLNRPSGLAIAPSTSGSGSTTGWSLYVSEFDFLWEKPSVPPPASTLVDSSLGLTLGRALAGAPHPRHGRPSVLAPLPGPLGAALLLGTEAGWLLALDACSGAVRPVAGPEQGLRGALVALASSPDGRRTVALNDRGDAFELVGGRVRALSAEPELVAAALERARTTPQRAACLRDPWTRDERWYALDGWAVWRVELPR